MITIINENTKSIHVNKTLDINLISKNIKVKESKITIDDNFEILLVSEEDNLFFNFNRNNFLQLN